MHKLKALLNFKASAANLEIAKKKCNPSHLSSKINPKSHLSISVLIDKIEFCPSVTEIVISWGMRRASFQLLQTRAWLKIWWRAISLMSVMLPLCHFPRSSSRLASFTFYNSCPGSRLFEKKNLITVKEISDFCQFLGLLGSIGPFSGYKRIAIWSWKSPYQQ